MDQYINTNLRIILFEKYFPWISHILTVVANTQDIWKKKYPTSDIFITVELYVYFNSHILLLCAYE